MKRIAYLLLLALLLTGCREAAPPATTEPTVPSTTAETTVPTEETTAPTQPSLFAGAAENYLLPLEEYSWEREEPVRFVMLHFTSNVVNDREDPFNPEALRKIFVDYNLSIHYIVHRDGTVECYIPEDRVAWHAGKGTFAEDEQYTNRMNHYAIGIEIAAIGSESDMAQYLTAQEYAALDPSLLGFTDAQYASLQALVRDLCSRYDIPMDRQHVLGHEDYSPTKSDPGELFDWDRVLN